MQLVIYMSKKYSKLPNIEILDEKDKRLKQKSENVTFPLPKEDLDRIEDMLTYLEMSQIDEYNQKYNLRAGWGLAYIQLGIPKRIFVLSQEVEDGKFERHIVINPKVKSVSEEMVYIEEGEGCLSVNRPTVGIVPRHARMKIEAYDEKGNLYEIRVREELAVGYQHELDHLDGILFTDKIDNKQPFKGKDKYRSI